MPPSPTPLSPPAARTWRSTVLATAALATMLTACSGSDAQRSDASAAPPPTAPPTAVTEPQPTADPQPTDSAKQPTDSATPSESTARLVSDDCGYRLAGEDIRCGVLEVPEDWTEPGEARVRLPYVILPALATADRRDDPIIYLEGGPGGSGLSSVGPFSTLTELRRERDLIFLEKRGEAASDPAFDCPSESITDFQDVEFARRCFTNATDRGMNPSRYSTIDVARDAVALRSLLGIEQWNLYGISYGTTLAQVISAIDPDGTRTVVLDSPTSPSVEIARADLESLLDGYSTIFAACAADPACDAAFPDLRATMLSTFDELQMEPWRHGVPALGAFIQAALGTSPEAAEFIDAPVFLRLLQTVSPTDLPATLTSMSRRDGAALGALPFLSGGGSSIDLSALPQLDGVPPAVSGLSMGTWLAVYCTEEAPFDTLDDRAAETAEPWPKEIVDTYRYTWDVCQGFPVEPSPPSEVELVRNDLPTLVLTGQFDRLTPRRQGEIIIEGLTNATLVDVPGADHGVAPFNTCAMSILVSFLDAPDAEPDRSCIADIAPPAWTGV